MRTPLEKVSARQHGQGEVRLMLLQAKGATRGTHAIAYIREECTGRYRRYDNDDHARTMGTFTWTRWSEIMQEWDAGGSAAYAVVTKGSLLGLTCSARQAASADRRDKRIRELKEAGVERRTRLRLLREEGYMSSRDPEQDS